MFKLNKSIMNSKINIKKLEKEGRYYDLFEFTNEGKIKYNNCKKAMNLEAKLETGKKYNSLEFQIKNLIIYKDLNWFKEIKYKLLKTAILGIMLVELVLGEFSILNEIQNNKIYEENSEGIDDYDNELRKYASQFDTSKMSDIYIIMSVMNHIRSNTRFGINPDVEEIGNYYRYVFANSNDIGQCRHMADEFTTIMNMIDPRYEAKNFMVNLNHDCQTFAMCNIEQPIYNQQEEQSEELIKNEKIKNALEIVIANHLVTILKPIDANYYLVVDVTNPSIGVLNNGKIYMFNSNDYSFLEYRPLYQEIFGGIRKYQEVNMNLLLSGFQNIDLDELDKIYGLEAQNEILQKIKK